jgi:hypothetical protein
VTVKTAHRLQSPDNPLQRSGHDKVHAPGCIGCVEVSGLASQVRRADAERDRYAARGRSLASLDLVFLRSA